MTTKKSRYSHFDRLKAPTICVCGHEQISHTIEKGCSDCDCFKWRRAEEKAGL